MKGPMREKVVNMKLVTEPQRNSEETISTEKSDDSKKLSTLAQSSYFGAKMIREANTRSLCQKFTNFVRELTVS